MNTETIPVLNETAANIVENLAYQVAQRHGAEIPHLCFKQGLRADGNCRACMVEIDGERVLAPSCCRTPQQGMVVHSTSERARHSQRMVPR